MKRIVSCIMLLVLLLPFQIKAILCKNEDKVKFQTLANNITTSYIPIEENGNVSFQIVLSNINEGLIIKDIKNNVTYPYSGSELIIYNLSPNTSYRFDVYTNDLFCKRELLYSHYVNTPPYNPYYQDEVCKGMENNELCQKWTNMTLPYEEFKKRVEAAKQITTKPIEETPKKDVKGIYDYILDFYLNYYYIVLPAFIVGGVFIIYRYNKKHDLF